MTDDPSIRARLLAARHSIDFAWSTWCGMTQPKSVTLQARIVVGEDWLQEHPSASDQTKGRDLLATLRAQLHEQRLAEEEPGPLRNARGAWDAAESRFLAAEHEYLRLVSDAAKRGISE